MSEKKCTDEVCEKNRKQMAQALRILAQDYPDKIQCNRSAQPKLAELRPLPQRPTQPPPLL